MDRDYTIAFVDRYLNSEASLLVDGLPSRAQAIVFARARLHGLSPGPGGLASWQSAVPRRRALLQPRWHADGVGYLSARGSRRTKGAGHPHPFGKVAGSRE